MANSSIGTAVVILICSILLFVVFANILTKRKNKLVIRLEKFLTITNSEEVQPDSKKEKKQNVGVLFLSMIGGQFKGTSFVRKWEVLLEQAAIPLKPEEFFSLRIVMSFGTMALVFLMGYNGIFMVLGLILGFWIPRFYLNFKKKRRLRKCSLQLAETLGTMANSMRAGFSFLQAMQLIGKETVDPIGPEFTRTLQDMKYGIKIEDAFEMMLKRLPNKDLELVVDALIIQRSSGGNLAELLETMQETIQGRVKVKEELNTLTAQGKLSAIIVTLLPVATAFYLNSMNPEFFKPMLENPLGIFMLIIGGIFLLMGWFIIQRMIRIEV